MKLDLSSKKEQVVFGDDAIVIQKYISGIKGGRTLNMSDFSEKVLKAGHVIVTKDGEYKPMPIKVTAATETTPETVEYDTLPNGYSYAGVLYRSILAETPSASIMTWGEVNADRVPYPMTSIVTAFKTACPHIDFIKDEEA